MKNPVCTAWVTALIALTMASAASAASFPPLPEALAALTSDAEVTVTEVIVPEWEAGSNFYFAFEPTTPAASVGFIIYPGAYVDPRSYAPFAHEIARQGFPTFIVKMINDLAVGSSAQRATRVISDHPSIAEWAVGGHSLGAFGACAYAREHIDTIDGAVLWAGYPTELARLDDKIIKALSIYGTFDGICTLDEIETSRQHLPPYTTFSAIEGGNHSQFGWYDTSPDPVQPGDNVAGITRQAQQDAIVQTTAAFLQSFNLCPADPHNDYDNDTICGDVDNCPYRANEDQADVDADAAGDVCDNCPSRANADQADTDTDTVGDVCDNCPQNANSLQEDTMPPGGNSCGDACECEGNFDGDRDQDSLDAATFKKDLGRSSYKNACSNEKPCNGDFTCDMDVDSLDAAKFKSDLGRSNLTNPCPSCPTSPWCSY